MCVTATAGAGAMMLLPAMSGTAAAGAALLAVGAIALLAGNAWGLMVSIPAHLTLVGRIWPQLAMAGGKVGAVHAAASAIVIVTAVPAIVLAAVVLPQLARHLVPGGTPRVRSLLVAVAAAALAAALILPAAL